MLEVAYRNLDEALVDVRDKQATRQAFFMTGRVPVPNGGRARIVFVPDEDGDFDIRGLTATVVAPSNIQGVRIYEGSGYTSFPLALGKTPISPMASSYAERGLICKIYDGKNDLMLSDPEPDATLSQNPLNHLVDVKNLFQPAYRLGGFQQPIPFRYYLPRENKLVFEFQNLDTAKGSDDNFETTFLQYHTVTIVLSGRKIDMETV